MKEFKPISEKIYSVCYDVELNVTRHNEIDAAKWARCNSVRHAHTIKSIIKIICEQKLKTVKVLNASGLACGHQDFSIVKYLTDTGNFDVEWTAFESPNSEYLSIPAFDKYVRELNINVELSDFKNETNLYGDKENYYDVILLTEIVEHLDHSTMLRALRRLRMKLADDGILIITTPNLISLLNRIRFLLGDGDICYFGDGITNLEKGLYGHITLYDLNRLQRILGDLGYNIKNSYTFDYGSGPRDISFIKELLHKSINIISSYLSNSSECIYIECEKGERAEILNAI